MLPSYVEKVLLQQAQQHSLSELQKISQSLTKTYRQDKRSSLTFTLQEALVYALVRMPATYAVLYSLLEKELIPHLTRAPRSFLDVGSGPGTGLLVALALWPSLSDLQAVEGNASFIQQAQALIPTADQPKIAWHKKILPDLPSGVYDLTLMSYALGELPLHSTEQVLTSLWERTGMALVIIEPGTKEGSERLLRVREILIKLGAMILAPCTHHQRCPLKDTDWCHFKERLDRLPLHRRVKGADLSFEDEKYSYLIVTREPATCSRGRIIKAPIKKKGHVYLDICSHDGLNQAVVTKKTNKHYNRLRKMAWGDCVEEEALVGKCCSKDCLRFKRN